jgi:hypothetical protein
VAEFADVWRKAAVDLGLDIIAPARVTMSDGTTVKFHVLLKNFGGASGILLGEDYEKARPYKDNITALGYAMSHYLPPSDAEVYDRENIIEVLADWGWTGPPEHKPAWLS